MRSGLSIGISPLSIRPSIEARQAKAALTFFKFSVVIRTRLSLDASRVPGSFFYLAFSLAFVAGIYFVTQTHVGAKSALLLLSNCDPLRWVRSWRAALQAFF